MKGVQLIRELSRNLNLDLQLSEEGTCGVFFDNDEIFFEVHEDQFYLIADLASAEGREDAYSRLLSANYLGQESGQAVLSLDTGRRGFTLHRILDGDLAYAEFEKILSLFVQAVRYWKEWLAQPSAGSPTQESNSPLVMGNLQV